MPRLNNSNTYDSGWGYGYGYGSRWSYGSDWGHGSRWSYDSGCGSGYSYSYGLRWSHGSGCGCGCGYEQHWNSSAVSVVAEPKENVKLGSYCPSEELLGNFIDVAMGIESNT